MTWVLALVVIALLFVCTPLLVVGLFRVLEWVEKPPDNQPLTEEQKFIMMSASTIV